MAVDRESEAGQGQKGAAQKVAPGLRLNSAKVAQLDELEDNLVDISENSRFAQWRQAHQDLGSQQLVSREEPLDEPISLEGRRSSAPRGISWKRWAYGLLGLLLAAGLFVYLVFFSPLLATRTIQIEGTSLLDESTVAQQLRPLEGVPLTQITAEDVTALLDQDQVLYGVTLEARPPHELLVQIHERVPVAVVEHEGSYVLVDNEGVQLGRAPSVEEAGVPLVAGGLQAVDSAAFATLTQVLAALPTSILTQVDEAKADSASTITLEMKDGTRVVWGSPEESDLKAKVLVQLMESVGEETEAETYDVSSPLVPTVK